jgi:hypothetical protein
VKHPVIAAQVTFVSGLPPALHMHADVCCYHPVACEDVASFDGITDRVRQP